MKRTKFPNGNGKNKGGRPTDYKEDMPERAFELCLLGLDDAGLARVFGVRVETIYAWKNDYPEFSKAIKDGGAPADAKVAHGTYQRAIGYDYFDTIISWHKGKMLATPVLKHMHPDVAAQSMWLRCRQRELWRETRGLEITGPNGGPIQLQPASADLGDFTDEELKLAASMGSKIKLLTDGKNGGNGDSDSGKG